MAVPRVCGRTPMWRLRPALPTVMFWWSALPTTPMVARQSARTWRISPEGRRSVAMPPSLAISWMPMPAERPSWPPRPGLQLDVVDDGADRDAAQRQRVADGDVDLRAGLDVHADPQAVRRQDVALLAVEVVQQRDVGGAVRVVLDRGDLGRHAVLGALEVDHAVRALGAAAAVAGGLAAVGVAAAGLLEALVSDFSGLGLGDLGEVRERRRSGDPGTSA